MNTDQRPAGEIQSVVIGVNLWIISNPWKNRTRQFPKIGNLRAVAALILLPALCSFGQQTIDTNAARTNVAPSPLIMRGLYEGRSSSRTSTNVSQGRATAHAVDAGLQAFKKSQNADGSWGTEEKKSLSTSLVLMALLGHGESNGSKEYGRVVTKAHEWLLGSCPTNENERIAEAIALSQCVLVNFGTEATNAPKREIEKIQSLLAGLKPGDDDPWTILFKLFRTPAEIERPKWSSYTREMVKRWAAGDVTVEPETLNAYVALRVKASTRFFQGGKMWNEFNHLFMPKMVERQLPSGLYPCMSDADSFACSALAIQAMEIYYAFAGKFWSSPQQPEKHEDVTVEVK